MVQKWYWYRVPLLKSLNHLLKYFITYDVNIIEYSVCQYYTGIIIPVCSLLWERLLILNIVPICKITLWLFCLAVQEEVCGLCGDFDGDGQNDFTTQGQLTVSNPLEFANSWKVSSTCPDVEANVDPCGATPNRHHWAKMMCSIIIGDTFKNCRNKVMTYLFLIYHYFNFHDLKY